MKGIPDVTQQIQKYPTSIPKVSYRFERLSHLVLPVFSFGVFSRITVAQGNAAASASFYCGVRVGFWCGVIERLSWLLP